MRPHLALLLALAALPLLLAGCAEGLSNAPGVHRGWDREDFQHDVISNGAESCPREGQDPLAPKGERRRGCPETPDATQRNLPASP